MKAFIGLALTVCLGVLAYFYHFTISPADTAALASLNFRDFPSGQFECTIQRVDFDFSFSGIMFVSFRKARIDFPDQGIHILAKNEIAYIWKDCLSWGFKGPASTALVEKNDAFAVSKSVICKRRWHIDATLFVVPTEVDFKDSQLMS